MKMVSIVTIPVPSISLKILFNTLGPNTLRSDITSFVSWLKMVLSLLSSFTLMIKRLTCSPSLQMVDALNSCAKTLVLYPWTDLSLSFLFFMHMHLVFMLSFYTLALFFFFCLFALIKNKNTKTMSVCVYWYLSTLDSL